MVQDQQRIARSMGVVNSFRPSTPPKSGSRRARAMPCVGVPFTKSLSLGFPPALLVIRPANRLDKLYLRYVRRTPIYSIARARLKLDFGGVEGRKLLTTPIDRAIRC